MQNNVKFYPNQEYPIICPKCSNENVHFAYPEFQDGEDDYKADWNGRGSLITIGMVCEVGHTWEFCIGFHKGVSSIFVRNFVTQHNAELLSELLKELR